MQIHTEEMEIKNIMTTLYNEANHLKTFVGKWENFKKYHLKIFSIVYQLNHVKFGGF